MLKHTFFLAAVLLSTFAYSVSAQEAVLSTNVVYGYDSTSYVTSIGTVLPSNNITNSGAGQRFNSGSGGSVSAVETIVGRLTLAYPLTIKIHESNANLPSTVLGSITIPANSVPEYDFADTPLTRFDLTSLNLELAPDTDYYVTFNSSPNPNNSGGNFGMRVIAPASPQGLDYVDSRNGGSTWNLPSYFFETGELPLTVFTEPVDGTIPLDRIRLTPTVDARAELVDGVFEIEEDSLSLSTLKIDPADIDRRAIIEYTLPDIPSDRRIVSAELRLDLNSMTGSETRPAEAEIYGYAADNLATPEDAIRTGLRVGTFGPVTNLEPVTVSFDSAWINTLVQGGTTEIGLLLVGGDNWSSLGFDANEFPDLDTEPRLIMTLQASVLADCNLDGSVDFLDIAPFISILSAADYLLEADVNEDGVVDFLDIQPFIQILSSI